MHNVSFPEEKKTFTINDNEILFNALDEQGQSLPHGCLSGSCGACKIEIINGHENMSEPSPIEQDTITAIKTNLKRIQGDNFNTNIQVRLACRAKVKGNMEFKTL